MRARIGALLVAGVIVATCSAPAATPSQVPSASPTATVTPSVAPSSTPAATGPWVAAGEMAVGRRTTHAIVLGDGTVLVIGNDVNGCVREDAGLSEVWDPSTGAWSTGPSLNKPRAAFAAVRLSDGRALVTGGMNAGNVADWGGQTGNAAYSSTYVYDPANVQAGWARAALLANARVAPAAATLLDGRVLVAGGYYMSGDTGRAETSVDGAVLAAYVLDADPAPGRWFFDVDPGPYLPALATAELYDPATDTWAMTGPLRFARIEAQAATLTDGRVLVVGTSAESHLENGWTKIDDRAVEGSELYDPATGRFTTTGALPAVDWSPIAALDDSGVDWSHVSSRGSLVALADGGALLVGRVTSGYTASGAYEGQTIRTLRFDPTGEAWTEVDRRVVAHRTTGDPPAPYRELVAGHAIEGAVVARLADGRVLVAGGFDPVAGAVVSEAELYDPSSDAWTALPAMPGRRQLGVAVTLRDGSVLLVGGERDNANAPNQCDSGDTGLASAVRFVPTP